MSKFLKAVCNAVIVLEVLFLLWVLVSFIDINAHNLTTCEYMPWNFFIVFFGI